MGIREEIQTHIKESLKEKQTERLLSLRFVWDFILKKEKDKRLKLIQSGLSEEEATKKGQLSDQEIQSLISSFIKKDKDALAQFRQAGREDLAKKEEQDIETLSSYLPEQLSKDELIVVVKEGIQESGAKDIKDMGKVIKTVIAKTQGRANGAEISQLVKELLS